MSVLIDVKPGSPEWLAARRGGVTATDIVTILGLSSHDSVYSLYWRKLGQVPDEPDRDRWELGRHMEPYIAQRWDNANDGIVSRGGLYRSDDRLWQLATPDYVIETASHDGCGPLECKSWADADRRSWEAGPPPAVRAQLLWQMDVFDAAAGYWAVVFLPSGRFDHGEIRHDGPWSEPPKNYPHDDIGLGSDASCEVCPDQALMRNAGEEFYRRLTLELPPPDPDSSAATLAALRARFARVPGKQAEVSGSLFAAWSDARDWMAEWGTAARGYEAELREQAGEAGELCVGGQVVAKRIVTDAVIKTHTRHADYYVRVKPKEMTDE